MAGSIKQRLQHWLRHRERNDSLADWWSLTHLMYGVLAGWLMDPFVGLLILVLWEPLEILVLSPLMERLFGIRFGFETLRNSLSDIVFDAAGVAIGFWLLRRIVAPPFQVF